MSNISSDIIKRYLGAIILLVAVASGVYTFFLKKEESRNITYSTSDARNLKGEFTIALDSWIGYFPFRSPVFGKLMHNEGYRIKIIDDNADYPGRMKMLKKGDVDFAVCTIDSYLLNGESVKYPGTIVTVIDESKGGDAIVAWKDKIANLDQLKTKKEFRIAFTPASPSEHLLKSISVHFGIPRLANKEDTWRVEVNGAKEAYGKLIDKKVDLATLWEPHVSEALAQKGIVKLIGSEDVEKLIVDILLVNRKFADKKHDLVKMFLKNYYKTLNIYNASPDQLTSDILKNLKVSKKQIKYMLKGVKWFNYPENASWFGLVSQASHSQPEIVSSIESTIKILIANRDFESNPLPDRDPYTIINSYYLKQLYNISGAYTVKSSANSLAKRFSKLSESQWKKLSTIGALKLRPISFRSGTYVLDENGHDQIRIIVNNVRHYPNFRILIKGHTGLRGDPEANIKLSKGRAKTVKKELQYTYNVDPNRIRILGIGAKEPMPRLDDESDRSYNNRLKRVEISFLAEK